MELSTYSVGLPQYGQIFPDVILFIGFCFCLYVGQARLEPASCATAGDMTAVLTLRNTARSRSLCGGRTRLSEVLRRPAGWTNRLKFLFSGFICRKPPVGDVVLFGHCSPPYTSMMAMSGAMARICSSCSSITRFLYSSIVSLAPADTRERLTSRPSTSA